jgi:uncharacterized membrane protein
VENHIYEWLNLTIRWIHVIVGIAWIGASFYFNWLENRLDRLSSREPGIDGQLWAVHGGGFYHLKKFAVAPTELPAHLHWFKWEAYATWMSGMALLVVAYYLNARAFVIDPSRMELDSGTAIAIGLGVIAASWLVYDLLCKSPLKHSPLLLGATIFLFFSILGLALDMVFSARAAYIHVGAAIGTVMVANVFFVIIPGQRELVDALREAREPDPEPGRNALLRSRHNNYFTLPVLFIMISGHFPTTYGHAHGWAVLIALSAIGVAVRHYFNIRHLHARAVWILPASFAAMVAVMWFTAPVAIERETTLVIPDADVAVIIDQRCNTCHAAQPTQPGFASPPAGLILEDMDVVKEQAERIYMSTVATNTMPLGNLSGMTETERAVLGMWLEAHIEAQR